MATGTAALHPPSLLRIPVTLVVGLIMPPLAIFAWILLSGSARTGYLQSGWVRAGGILVVAGVLPLLAIIAAAWIGLWPDPDPNPIGAGLF
ncbi:MAG: hypothetical protein ACREQV_12265, partial [Candidatus Binatia bacterium]